MENPMPTTRSTPLLRRTLALAAAPALVLTIAACGDDGGGDAASFCDEVEDPFASLNDPNADPQETVDALREVDPPSEIADDWDTLVDALDTIASMDPEDAASEDALATLTDPDIAEAGENINNYRAEECGDTP
jgi:hypothetical protein